MRRRTFLLLAMMAVAMAAWSAPAEKPAARQTIVEASAEDSGKASGDEAEAEKQTVEVTFTKEDIPGFLMIGGVFLAIMGFAFWKLKERSGVELFPSDAEEASFERVVLRAPQESAEKPAASSVSSSPQEIDAPPQAVAPRVAIPAPARSVAAIAPPQAPKAPSATTIDAEFDAFARQLQAMGLFSGVAEGRVPLALAPDGVVYRLLDGGGRALVLPRLESEAAMANFSQRYDKVIVRTADGGAMVVTRL